MRAYRSFFRIRFSNGLQYRAAALAGVVTQFFWVDWNSCSSTPFTGPIRPRFPWAFPN